MSRLLLCEIYEYIGTANIEKIKTLAPVMQEAAVNLYKECQKLDIYFEIVSARRSFKEQKKLYNEMAPIYGYEKVESPGKSLHEIGMAMDIKIGQSNSYNSYYEDIAKIWKEMNKSHAWVHVWGGDNATEYWHFSIKEGS